MFTFYDISPSIIFPIFEIMLNIKNIRFNRYVLGDKMPDLTEDNHGALILTWGNKEIDNGLDLSKLFDDINASIYRWRCLRDGKKPDNLQYYGINERTTFFDFEVIGWGKMFQRKDENDENKQKDGIIFL